MISPELLNENSLKWLRLSFFFFFGLAVLILLYFPNYSRLQKAASLNKKLTIENQWLKTELSSCRSQPVKKKLKSTYAKKIEIRSIGAGFALYLKGEPFLVTGVGYSPIPVGEGYDYDFFANRARPWLLDGELMKAAGINAVRIYSAGQDIEAVKTFIRDMYDNYGIYTIMSDWLGLWEYPRANYCDLEFQAKTKERILKLVEALKDEEGLLMWILGNENNYTFSGTIGFWTCEEVEASPDLRQKQIKRAEIYYKFLNDLAKEIKKIDKTHPVALGNGEANFLEVAAKYCSDIDLLAVIIYRGKKFGNLFNNIRNTFNKPILLSEFGCDSFDAFKQTEDQDIQSEFILSQWKDLYKNTAFSGNPSGNVIGGCLFEWNDEWWKHNEGYKDDWKIHNSEAGWSHGAYFFDIRAENNLNMNEEWFGIVSLDTQMEDGLNKRILKKAYYTLKDYFSHLNIYNLPEKYNLE